MIVSLFVEYSKIIVLINTIYSNTGNLVLRARSEQIRFAVTECHGGSAFVPHRQRRVFGGTGWRNGVLAPVKCKKRFHEVKIMSSEGWILFSIQLVNRRNPVVILIKYPCLYLADA